MAQKIFKNDLTYKHWFKPITALVIMFNINIYCKSLNKHNLTARIICVHRKVLVNAIAYK